MKKKYLTVKECREIQINILRAIDKICHDNDIHYCITGGTLLGAIRHKGFIPWDDDVDVMLFRENYDKLIDILKKQTDYPWLEVLTLDYKKGYYYTFAKATDNRTVAKQDDNTSNHGVWVDIFPYDSIPNDPKKMKRFISSNYRKRSVVLSMLTDFKADKKIDHKFIKRILKLYSVFINKEKFLKKYNEHIQKYKGTDARYIGSAFSQYKYKECFEKQWFQNVKKYKFENYEFLGPEKADEYLTHLYGNYMELPPVEKRKNHKVIAWRK